MLLLRGGRILCGRGLERQLIADSNVLIDCGSGRIERIGVTEAELAGLKRAVTVKQLNDEDVVMPGLICSHGHFYGMFARGMNFLRAGESAPADFTEVLSKLWWRLDRALDLDATRLSTLVCCASAIRCGTTTIVDHHSSPGYAKDSLRTIGEATRQAGVRCALAFEVSDRNGPAEAAAGMDENERGIELCAASKDGMLSATFGLHASFTLGEQTLAECVQRKQRWPGVGFHVHLAESDADERHSLAAFGKRTALRLADAGALDASTLLGHGVHIDDDEIEVVRRAGAALVTNAASNANNGVGLPRVSRLLDAGVPVGMGTDGMSYDMFAEYQFAYLAHKLLQRDPRAMPGDRLLAMLQNANADIANRLFAPFGAPELGAVEQGAAADLIVVRYHSPTPLNYGNLPWHLMFGMAARSVHTTIINGRLVMDDHRLLTIDEADIAKQARKQADHVWQRVQSI